MKRKILALITAQESCIRIIKIAKEYARHLSCELKVVTVQPKKADAPKRSKDIICLNNLSKQAGAEVNIIYSDTPIKAIISKANKLQPVHIFAGQGSEGSQFIKELRLTYQKAPISIVGIDSIVYTLPPILEEALALEEIG